MDSLKPWMAKYIRDPHPGRLPDGMEKTQLAASHAIAEAIDANLQSPPPEEAEPVGWVVEIRPTSIEGAAWSCVSELFNSERNAGLFTESHYPEDSGPEVRIRKAFLHPPQPSEAEREAGELCERCEKRSPFAFHAPDPIWKQVTGQDDGKWCPICFEEVARAKGVGLHWRNSDNLWDRLVDSREGEAERDRRAMEEVRKGDHWWLYKEASDEHK